MEIKFYRCPVCGNVIVKMVDSGVVPSCCGEPMEQLTANTTDGKSEYHIPVVECTSDNQLCVKVGKEQHPMLPNHHIMFIFIETVGKDGKRGGSVVCLKPEDKPECVFRVCSPSVVRVYEYCNIHGLWKQDVADCCRIKDEKGIEKCSEKSTEKSTENGSDTH